MVEMFVNERTCYIKLFTCALIHAMCLQLFSKQSWHFHATIRHFLKSF